MIRKKAAASLDPWFEHSRTSLVTSFANGIAKDLAAVRAAIVSPWSNGQTEARSPSSSSSNARYTAAPSSICSKQDWSVQYADHHHQKCVRAPLRCRSTGLNLQDANYAAHDSL